MIIRDGYPRILSFDTAVCRLASCWSTFFEYLSSVSPQRRRCRLDALTAIVPLESSHGSVKLVPFRSDGQVVLWWIRVILLGSSDEGVGVGV